ncbi:MAG TPA: SLBB domain-containing protein [Gemmatimonadaceae bacterium]
MSSTAGFVRNCHRSAAVLALALVAFPVAVTAQSPRQQQAMSTRAELESLAATLESGAAPRGQSEVWARRNAQGIRARLASGDFRPGDRIFVSIATIDGPETHTHAPALDPNIADTLTVGPGSVLTLRAVGDVPLAGVLRSELQAAVEGAVARLYRNATVRTEPLIRIAVLEGVEQPGYYDVSSNLVLSDLVMRAGGPSAKAALDKITVKRRGAELYSAARARAALQQQLTLDQMDIQTGDVMVVPFKRSTGLMQLAQVAGSIATITLAIIYAAGR